MARLEAVAKGLFYPSPMTVMGLIAKVVQCPIVEGGSLLDPCAGEGTAAAFLARWWGLQSYGIELDAERAALAAVEMDTARRGSYHQLTTKPEKAFSVLFLNPPYDEDVSEDGASMRQEVVFLRAAAKYLVHNGLLVLIVPARILKLNKFHEVLSKHFREARAWKFPDPEIQAFNQVVLFARRHCPEYGSAHYYGGRFYGSSSEVSSDLQVLGTEMYGEGSVPVPAVVLEEFRLRGRPPEDYVPSFDPAAPMGVYASARWDALTSEADQGRSAPLVAPRPGHQAMLLAAGALNGVELDGCIIKGGSSKTTTEIQQDDEDKCITIVRERIVSHLSALSLETGDLDTWRVDEDPTKTAEWFQKNGEALARAILEGHSPSFNGDLSRYDFSKLRAPGVLPGHSEPELLPIQMEAAAATVHRWKKHKTTILCGEQGTGKTTMAILATSVAKHRKVVVVCPSHLVPKWIRETNIITGEPNIARTARKISEVDRFFEDPTARFLILSKEMAKLGSRWVPAYQTRNVLTVHEKQVREEYWMAPETVITRSIEKCVTCPSCGSLQDFGGEMYLTPRMMDQKLSRNCFKCKQPLWTSVPLNAKGTLRWPLARHINRRYAHKFSLVIDEAHQAAGAESDQARAVHMLATAATKILAMTGTLYGGRASSIFHLLYRIDYRFRQMYEHNECAKFVAHHGLFETTYEENERTSVYHYRKGRTGGRIKEIPGMSPAMIPLLLPYTLFVKLKDMRLELPPYSEEVEIVDHDQEVTTEVRHFAEELKTVLKKHPQVLGQYLQACLGYPDRPDQAEAIMVTTEEGGTALLASARAFSSETLWPKDLRVAEICKSEVALGRKCLVYFAQTHRRDARMRVKKALESQGLRVAILDSNVPPEKREQWLFDAEEKGFDVLLTNGRLVETGMDLLFAKTIIQYGIEYSLASLRQSIRRSWRLGQTHPVRVIFMAYRGTMQETAINLIARKMRAAEMVDGDEAGGLAQHDVGGTNFLVELAQEAISTRVRIRDRWASNPLEATA